MVEDLELWHCSINSAGPDASDDLSKPWDS